jgi:hypothetical protein
MMTLTMLVGMVFAGEPAKCAGTCSKKVEVTRTVTKTRSSSSCKSNCKSNRCRRVRSCR